MILRALLFLNTILLPPFLSAQQNSPIETVVQTGHYEKITELLYSSDGRFLLSASEDRTMKLWETITGREVRTFQGSPYAISAMAINNDNTLIASVNGDSTAWIWNAITGERLNKIGSDDDIINNILFHPNGKWLISGNKNYNYRIWDIQSGDLIKSVEGEPIGCYSGNCRVSLKLSKDGKELLTGISDRTVILWNLEKGEQIWKRKDHKGRCSSCMMTIGWLSSGKEVLGINSRDSMRIWSARNGKKVKELASEQRLEWLSVDDKGQKFILGDGILAKVYNSEGKLLKTLGSYQQPFLKGAITPDGSEIALANGGHTISVYRLSDWGLKKELKGLVAAFEDSLNSIIRTWIKNKSNQALSPDGRKIARCKIGNEARIWDIETGRVIQSLKGHTAPVLALAFSPDGSKLATASADRSAILWDLNTGKELQRFIGHSDILFSINFSSSGKELISTAWDGKVIIWNADNGRPVSVYRPHAEHAPVDAVFALNDLYFISTGLDQRVALSERDTGKPIREFIGHSSHVVSLDLHPDGKKLLTASWDGKAKVWDLSTGFQEIRLSGHKREVLAATFSKDGKYIVTGGADQDLRVWDGTTGDLKQVLKGHRGGVTSAYFISDNKILSGSRDGTSKVWLWASEKEIFTHIFPGGTDWLITVPDGRFYGTDAGIRSIFFVKELETYSLDRFYQDYFDPKLPLILKTIDEGVDRGTETGLSQRLENHPPASLEIISPSPPYNLKGTDLEILVRAENKGGGLKMIQVQLNGKTLIVDSLQVGKKVKKGKSIVRIYQLNLLPGNNFIQLTARNDLDIDSRPVSLQLTAPGIPPKPKCYILSIGINKYQNEALNLNYAKSDAKSFTDEIKKRGNSIYESIEVIDLYDQRATKEGILAALLKLSEKVEMNDVFYFFYAGHGSLVDDTFYFVPHELTRLYDPEMLSISGITDQTLNEYFKKIKALKQVVVMDACHSGGSTEQLANRGAGEEKALAQLSRSAGIHVLAAAGSDQTAAEFKQLGHGLFTYMILKALSGEADGAPNDQRITVYELKSFLDSTVPEYSEKYKGSPQYPSTFSRGQDFPLIVIDN